MTAMQGALSAAERSMRSVFVGNIPYEATEEQLKDIFSEVGPVVGFRLVYDRETGKPKGYGFCEYKDQEMALSAMRNLNGYELNGRALRVDNAASEKSKEELKNLQASLGGPPVESPFGPEVNPEKAPETVSKIMASLPPEQLYELMKQMKSCLDNNPNEARNLLMQNPQLTYALLQALVIMKVLDPDTAVSMLHTANGTPVGLLPTPDPKVSSVSPQSVREPAVTANEIPRGFSAMNPNSVPASSPAVNAPRSALAPPPRPSLLGDRPPPMPAPPMIPAQFAERGDPRLMGDQDLRQPPMIDHDMRAPIMSGGEKDMRHAIADQDFRTLGGAPVAENRGYNESRYRNAPMPEMGSNRGPSFDRSRSGPAVDARGGYERNIGMSPRMEDPRNTGLAPVSNTPPSRVSTPAKLPETPRVSSFNTGSPHIGTASPNPMSSPRAPSSNSLAAAAAAIAPDDQEKAALIMQVLQLSDQQIALLPPEQRQSIMVLKEQIARSQQTP